MYHLFITVIVWINKKRKSVSLFVQKLREMYHLILQDII